MGCDDILRRLLTFIAFFYPQFGIARSVAEKGCSYRPGPRENLWIGERGLVMEVTVEDPKVFSRPWKMRLPLYRRLEPNVQILDYECHSFD